MTNRTPRVALVTGATQGLGLALVEGLARRLDAADTVYLTGRDAGRVADAVAGMPRTGARVRGELFDVADPAAAARLADVIAERHGGVDVVFGNAVMRVGPDDDPRAVMDEYTQVNNFGTTRLMRAFAPLVRDGGRFLVVASSLGTLHHLAPVLHGRFDRAASLDEVDKQVAAWRDAVQDGSAAAGAWPAFVNIPSKIAQVAAVRALAGERRAEDLRRGILLAAVCPGMINTPTSGLWWDVSGAATPAEAAVPLLDLALNPIDPAHYGELVRYGRALPWRPAA
ncbi:NAD(P)-dependent dehydrogenase (short-subunit alcohol dehydrogenase family) [Nonomuraea thailandensis]|uniref:NAD(P)-dependent dehydrogenase (Short-subunit alcohol dehydrogenase family) n=1 Tax=Nonomuraea thailandensis TaxID=1188745 RepID=A0A9X2GMA2_9ACTN|nr:SDR family NAD(P)-dependent oxidoreductase [Nonomuraea thailandensis]MCP2360184.1 NAD(P)-dependent dehydrogenase (short-subunit alcohol dehydrogenase family) [Nonomuraea thailandensis]